MATKFEVGTWTGNNTSPQTITLADSSLTPIAIIVWMVGAGGTPTDGVAANQVLSMGFGTRRGGSTQSGCVGIWSSDNVATTSTGRVRNTTLLHVLSAETTTDYTVSLSSFGSGQFTVTYSSAANANGDVFQYAVFGGSDLTDAQVLNWTMDGTTTEVITGVGFQPDVLFALDADLSTTNTPTSNMHLAFGCATSPTQFWTQAVTATDADTMASGQNWNNQGNVANCLARLTINADTQNALWDLNSFDSDGCTLGVNDAPAVTTQISTFLFIKGGSWEAGQKAKSTSAGNDTFTLTNSELVVRGVLLGNNEHTTNALNAATTSFVLGAGSSPNTTRASARNICIGLCGDEIINTHADRFGATDSIAAIITDGSPSTVLTEAWYDTASTGSFIIEWATADANAHLISYLAIGDSPAAPAPPPQFLFDRRRQVRRPAIVQVLKH